MTREREGGFSLIELLVAMTITLIVSGAIYGLLASGQNAFRREPELTERQQNIRLAMDLIMRDTANAGVSLPPFTQVFTTGLDADPGSPAGPSGDQSDQYELITGSNQESEPVCVYGGGGANNATGTQLFLVRTNVPPIDPDGPAPSARKIFLVLSSNRDVNSEDRWTTRRVTAQDTETYAPAAGGGSTPDCAGGTHARVTFANTSPGNAGTLCELASEPPTGNVTGGCGGPTDLQVTRIVYASQVRYRIRAEPDGVPVLQRSSTDDPSGFQTLARGIEELQVQYTAVGDPDTWLDEPPPVADPALPPADAGGYTTLVGQVRVTLTSRSEARNIQGATNNASGDDPRIRGTLVSTAAPRATLMHLARNRPPSPIPSPGLWYWE